MTILFVALMGDPRQNLSDWGPLISRQRQPRSAMLELLIVIGRALALALRGHQKLVWKNLALRQQLPAVTPTNKRSPVGLDLPILADVTAPGGAAHTRTNFVQT